PPLHLVFQVTVMTRPSSSAVAPRHTEVETLPVPALARPASPEAWADLLVRTFNDVRDELISTLWYLLGNQDDAQDMAQEVFLRCWRTQENLPEVQNLRAWIFRVGLNAARDLQRSAWKRRVKPLVGTEIMSPIDPSSPAAELEDRESLDRLRAALHGLREE